MASRARQPDTTSIETGRRRNGKAPAESLRVVTYHRVADPEPSSRLSPQLISATVSGFARQMEFLARNYQAVRMETVLEAALGRKALPKRAVIITFDDAYHDLVENALPVLRRLRLPATVFVPTAYPNHPEHSFWWDRLYGAVMFTSLDLLQDSPVGTLRFADRATRWQAVRRLQNHIKTLPHHEAMAQIDSLCQILEADGLPRKTVMDWDELRQAHRAGIDLAAHTRTHALLDRIPLADARDEIAGSQADLEREIGSVLPAFSYPNGNHNDAIVQLLREEGFVLGFTCLDGHNDLSRIDPLRLCRTDITRKTTPLLFRLRLMPMFTHIDRWRHG